MAPQLTIKSNFDIITIAVIIAIVLGTLTSIFFMVGNKETYSAIYLVPNSIVHYTGDSNVIYGYGVKSTESGKTDYTLNTYVNSTLVKTRQFSLNNGEILDGQDKIVLPADTPYPSKISLRLVSSRATEEVHFWIK
jgi:hypothetical protein